MYTLTHYRLVCCVHTSLSYYEKNIRAIDKQKYWSLNYGSREIAFDRKGFIPGRVKIVCRH